MTITAPTLNEIMQVCSFAESRIEDIENDPETHGELSDWEAHCLGKVYAWVKSLEKLSAEDTVLLALETAAEATEMSGLPEVEGIMTLSTAHITGEASIWLSASHEFDGMPVYENGDYGFFVPVLDQPAPQDMPLSIEDCMGYADQFGCKWICFDRDGPKVTGLGTYEW